MSVSLALLPVALAMRIVMGKEGFNNWIESQQVRVPTNFTVELDLVRTIKKAGYDAIKFGSSIKTHIQGEKTFFFWELVDGRWQAVFSKHHEQAVLSRFMTNIESEAGSKVFGEMSQHVETVAEYPTNFRDGALLMEALMDFGANPIQRANGQIVCKVENSKLVFTQKGDEPYLVEITNAPSLEEAYHYLSDVDQDYKRCVQTDVYNKLKSRITSQNMTIENEEVVEDNSIVITLNIQNIRV
ncbi:hypothetical protein [Nitrosomonas sp.]|uniref:hypothetical protein n=1 Tax=Nitrosomonas sp. TaxID=42353 RepID=UPI00260BE336|nr:hypothetical protein [Nitrosomonas sp.]MCW5601386.1 hypothetical protein [Nitrosomonas sp.]